MSEEIRTFTELDSDEQTEAENVCLSELLHAIVADGLRFNDEANNDDVQARIDAAAQEMDDMQTPWFLAERIMEDEKVAELLRGIARADAEDAYYPAPGITIVRLQNG